MHKVILAFSVFWVLLQPPLAAQVNIARDIEPIESGAVRKKITIQIPGGSIRYNGVGKEGGFEVQDPEFGLSFHRPAQTNGGWSLWDFLQIRVKTDGNSSFVVSKKYLLDDVELLEDGERTVLQFMWPLLEEGGKLFVTIIQYSSQLDWLFIRTHIEGGDASIDKVAISCFPGNTTGPEERERWVAIKDSSQPLPSEKLDVSADNSGYVFFNKLAQDDSGCLLVVDTEPIGEAWVQGGYSVDGNLILKDGQKDLKIALGGFLESQPEDVVRVFQMEGAANTLNYLKRIDWLPKLDFERQSHVISDVNKMIDGAFGSADGERMRELNERYQKAVGANNIGEIRAAFRDIDSLRNDLMKEKLEQLK